MVSACKRVGSVMFVITLKKVRGNVKNSALAAERACFAVQNRMNYIAGLNPGLKLNLGNLLLVALFGCHIWGVIFLDLRYQVDDKLIMNLWTFM